MKVQEAIWQMWTVFDGLRTQAHDLVGKKLFMTYFLKVGKVVLGEDDFDIDDMTEMANEEYDRQLARCAEKQASNGEEVVAHDCEDGGLDFDIFYESMFELIDYEVSVQIGLLVDRTALVSFGKCCAGCVVLY